MVVRNYIKNLLALSENMEWPCLSSNRKPRPGVVQMILAIEDYIFKERLATAIACARKQFAEYDVPTRRTLRT
jgi:hypothetical protein